MSKTSCVLGMLLAVAACGSKDDKKGGGDKGGKDKAGAVEDYRDKAINSEAKLQLHKLASAAKEQFQIEGSFPSGKVGPVPAEACCKQPDKKCKPDAKLWSDPVWQKLSFAIDDSFYFQYSYEGDGKSFAAKAIGCDGKAFTASGVATAGNPQIEYGEP